MELPSNLTYSQVQDTINMADHKFPILKTHHQSQLTQLTHTIYDQAIDLGNQNFIQENLRNRVSASFRFDDYAAYQNYLSDPNNKENHIFTLYSYDEIGNVKRMANHTPRIVEGNNLWVDSKFKTIDYQYDLVSGNVNKVIYQKGKEDRFMHRYRYDADNRLEQVETSKDNVIWEKDAHYYYYPHGPLARIELGEHQVQGIDYYYTLQGWLKGINGKDSSDPGKDGIANSPHASFPKDIFALQLAYYQDDYQAIGNANTNHLNVHWTHNLWNNHTDDVTQKNGLYNGNIAMQYTYLQPFSAGEQQLVSHYRYDQLNRLKGAVGGFYDTNNLLPSNHAYKTEYSYDAMGNISYLKRQQGNTTYDSLRYYYEYNNVGIQTYNTGNQLLHNKLNRVQDLITSHNVANTNDLPSGQDTDNYHYDSIGNLIQDVAEEIENIEWDVYGKITKIERTANSTKEDLVFKYDATGNRILKIVLPRNGNPIRVTSYHRDAQGNVLSTEESDAVPTSTTSPIPTTREYTLYGSSRLGVFKTYALGTTPQVGDYYMTKTDKYYELTNHLGNVMAVLSDAKHYDHNAQHFTTHTAQAQDYLPFGMLMPGRKYTNTSLADKYRFGFNGKELDNETSTYDYGFRIYNSAIAKFLSIDPLSKKYPMLTSYQFASNMPIWAVDLDGLEAMTMTTYEWTTDGSLIRYNTTPIETNPVERNAKYGDKGLLNIVFNLDVSPTIPSNNIYTNEVVVTPTKIEKLQRSMALKKQEMRYQVYHTSEDMVKNMSEWSRGLDDAGRVRAVSTGASFVGDALFYTGIALAPFTGLTSLSMSTLGGYISLAGTAGDIGADIMESNTGVNSDIRKKIIFESTFIITPDIVGKYLSKQINPSKFTKDFNSEVKKQREQINVIIKLNFDIMQKTISNTEDN